MILAAVTSGCANTDILAKPGDQTVTLILTGARTPSETIGQFGLTEFWVEDRPSQSFFVSEALVTLGMFENRAITVRATPEIWVRTRTGDLTESCMSSETFRPVAGETYRVSQTPGVGVSWGASPTRRCQTIVEPVTPERSR